MLRDAALLELDLLLGALDEGLVLKDASPYNVQWRGSKPVFVDIGSFERLREGEPWAGYRQFCTLVLYPLMLQAYKSVPFQPWLRGSLEGIEPAQMRALMGFRDRFRRGVLTNVVLHARLEGRYADREVKSDLKKAGFHTELVRANARKLRKLVERLEWEPGSDGVVRIRRGQPVRRGRRRRQGGLRPRVGGAPASPAPLGPRLQRRAVHARSPRRGRVHGRRRRGRRGRRGALPRASRGGLGNDPPAGRERRRPLARPRLARRRSGGRSPERGRPDLTLCLALVHHVSLSGNVPSAPSSTGSPTSGPRSSIEIPTRDDPMVQSTPRPRRARARIPTTKPMRSSARWTSAGASSGARPCPPARGFSTVRLRPPDPPGSFRGPRLHLGGPLGARDRPAALRPALPKRRVLRRARLDAAGTSSSSPSGIVVLPPLLLLGLEALAGLAAPEGGDRAPPRLPRRARRAARPAGPPRARRRRGRDRRGDRRRRRAGLRTRARGPRECCCRSSAPRRFSSSSSSSSSRRCPASWRARRSHTWPRRRRGRRWSWSSSTSFPPSRSCARTARSTPCATRTSPDWPRTRPGTGTPRPCTSGRPAPCRRCSPGSGPDGLPLFLDHPDNLFTLLGGAYDLNVHESQTHLCPPELCDSGPRAASRAGRLAPFTDLSVVYGHLVLPEDLADELPSISTAWRDFGDGGRAAGAAAGGPGTTRRASRRLHGARRRGAGVRRVRSGRSERPTLSFLHVLLPHHPWEYLPDGKIYASDLGFQPGPRNEGWVGDPELAIQAHQRHLLQVGYTDLALGRILDRLEETGLYDESLVVVVADHGVSFRPRGERRRVEEGNMEEIAFVPLFVKAPGQTRGETVDGLGADDRHRPDGRRHARRRSPVGDSTAAPCSHRSGGDDDVLIGTSSGEVVEGDAGRPRRAARRPVLARQVERSARSDDEPGLFGIGPRPELLGLPPTGWPRRRPAGLTFESYGDSDYDPTRRSLPCASTGASTARRPARTSRSRSTAAIVAVTRSFEHDGDTLVSAVTPRGRLPAGREQRTALRRDGLGRRDVPRGAAGGPLDIDRRSAI